MSYFRPSPECIYAIGDIHGNFEALNLILNRITPLRKDDKIIFLGDYIDRGPDSYKVIEKLIELKSKYKDQVICLSGNHEYLMLSSFGYIFPAQEETVQIWFQNGGIDCLRSYAKERGISEKEVQSMNLDRFKKIVPDSHIKFLKELDTFHEMDDYIFVHAGCDPYQSLESQSLDILIWDRSLFRHTINCIKSNTKVGDWKKTVVTGHNYRGPIINEKYMMIDCSLYKQIMCLELNSMEAYTAEVGNKRMVKHTIRETQKSDLEDI